MCFWCFYQFYLFFKHSLSTGHIEDIGLICYNKGVMAPYNNSWVGLQWAPEVNATHLESLLSYTDIEYAGFTFDSETLQHEIVPAISAFGIPPFLDNVDVKNNFGDGVKFSDVPIETAIFDSRIANNGETGVYFSTVGLGRVYMDATEIVENGGFGIVYAGNTYPEDSHHYRFCSYNMSIDKYIYFDHTTSDFIDPYECVQV